MAHKHRTAMYIASSSMAEMIADVFLCPFEATKLKMQTSKIGTFPTDFFTAWHKIKQ
jgi:solute carrier family 25 phosphate transporter 3